jgi:hypothetical protein
MGGGLIGIIVTVTTLVAVGGSLFFVFRMLGGISGKQAELNRLLQTGMPGTGRIVGLGATGMSVTVMGHRHLDVALTVEVQVPGRPPYMVQTSQLISELRLPSVQPGAQVAVRVDPMNPMKIAIADGAPPGMAAGGAPGWGGPPMGAQPMGGMGAQPMGGMGMGGQPMGGYGGQPMMMGGGGFVAPDVNQAIKKSLLSPFSLFIFFITTVPICVIMLAVFVDWSAFMAPDDDEPATPAVPGAAPAAPAEGGIPKGGYCEATVRCCKVVFNDAPGSNCDQMGKLPAAGCKSAYDGYVQSAKAQGKTCN